MAKVEEKKSARHKSARKRSIQNEARRKRNSSINSGAKTAVKKVVKAVMQSDKEGAIMLFAIAAPALQKAVAGGVLHKKNAARRISRMAKKINKLA
ncbi:MAG: 30S ribosomal protein S20 [Deltaproteobacteria bacterium]|nr:30S ribosomal protein S20 [Deltaproteobacteria bacterium]